MGRGEYYRHSSKRTTADFLSIKIADLYRYKAWSTGRHFWSWKRNGERTGSVSFLVAEDRVTFQYSTKDSDGNSTGVDKAIRITTTDSNYGGKRKWFLCGCGKRVGRIFFYGQHVACRHCFNLAYPTQNGDEIDRAWARIHRLEARLKDDHYRPKGMHWKTFRIIKEKLLNEHYQKDLAFAEIARRRFPWMEF